MPFFLALATLAAVGVLLWSQSGQAATPLQPAPRRQSQMVLATDVSKIAATLILGSDGSVVNNLPSNVLSSVLGAGLDVVVFPLSSAAAVPWPSSKQVVIGDKIMGIVNTEFRASQVPNLVIPPGVVNIWAVLLATTPTQAFNVPGYAILATIPGLNPVVAFQPAVSGCG